MYRNFYLELDSATESPPHSLSLSTFFSFLLTFYSPCAYLPLPTPRLPLTFSTHSSYILALAHSSPLTCSSSHMLLLSHTPPFTCSFSASTPPCARAVREVEVGIPSAASRAAILTKLLSRLPSRVTQAHIVAAAACTHGYVGADLLAACKEAAQAALRRAVDSSRVSTSPGTRE